jgi:hypothetical protein
MHLLLNLILAVLAFILTDFVLARMNVGDPVKVLVAVLVAIVVFFADLASNLH